MNRSRSLSAVWWTLAPALWMSSRSYALAPQAEEPSAAERASDPLAQAEAYLQETFPGDAPGAAVLVIHRGEVLLEKGYGQSDLEDQRPITSATNFDLASVSKQFTAMAVMILADRGKLAFEDDARKFLPELPVFDEKRPIRIADLLQHTSGLPDYLGFWQKRTTDFAEFDNEDVLELMRDVELEFPTGTRFEYSNSNYALLPVLVGRVAEKPFSRFVQQEIFEPLGMRRTVIVDDIQVVVPERAKGYRKDGDAWARAVMDGPTCGDGNVFSNLQDFRRWEAALAASELVAISTYDRAFSPGKLDAGAEFSYGFGWFVDPDVGFVGHGGGWAGTRTFIGRWLADELTVVVLSNREDTVSDEVARRVADFFRES